MAKKQTHKAKAGQKRPTLPVTHIVAAVLFFVLITLLSIVLLENSGKSQDVFPGFDTDTTACTEEAKICPDGTAVGRTGPNCEFAPCPDSTATEAGVFEDESRQSGGCVIAGCSGQLCLEASEAGSAGVTTCEFKEEYSCYNNALCERQNDGECDWKETNELISCLEERR